MHIVDRRLNPGSKSLENRQRFLRRAKALVQGAVKKSSQDRDIKDVLEGGEVSIPARRHERAALSPRGRHARHGAARQQEVRRRRHAAALRARAAEGRREPGEGDGEDAFRFVLSRDEFVDLFLDDLELPDLAKRKLAEAESEGLQPRRLCDLRLARQYFGQPHRAAGDGAPGRVAAAAAGDDRAARGGDRRLRRGAPRRADGRDRGAEGQGRAGFPSSIRSTSATAASRPCRSRWRRR